MKADIEFGKKMLANEKRKRLTKVEKEMVDLIKPTNYGRELRLTKIKNPCSGHIHKITDTVCTYDKPKKFKRCKSQMLSHFNHNNIGTEAFPVYYKCVLEFGHDDRLNNRVKYSKRHSAVIRWS
jgi:hypothetical protein